MSGTEEVDLYGKPTTRPQRGYKIEHY